MHSIQGGWRGSYFYTFTRKSTTGTVVTYNMDTSHGYGFQAMFVEKDGVLRGSILDDGKLGDAECVGTFNYPLILFTKVYKENALNLVEYEGVMSNEERLCQEPGK